MNLQSLLDGLDTLDPEYCQGFANIQRAWMGQPSGVKVTITLKVSYKILLFVSSNLR